ncbi:hypothetical protein CTI12_AA596900 [Artemisia annua]|uniref:Alpha-1,4 glucan phosphorylase n=1 Tax=Artemisia annua TaxID=35608 RepID=A0A2U1KJ02_ARTAN|nr:hypothetical protein CTI12_AA596900 [Artemisia annua]
MLKNESSHSSLKSDEPDDEVGDSVDGNNKSAPNISSSKPDVSTDETAVTADTTDLNVTDSTSSRKDSRQTKYATETDVSEGIQSAPINDDDYESEGEDLDMFGHIFESPNKFESPEPAVGVALKLGAGAVFGMSFGHEIANLSLKLYKLDTMAARVNFMEWWQRKSTRSSCRAILFFRNLKHVLGHLGWGNGSDIVSFLQLEKVDLPPSLAEMIMNSEETSAVDTKDEYVESNEEEEAELQPAPIPLKMVCMANMCVVGGHVVNGVADIHIEIVKQDVFSNFYKFSTDKFQKETNGVTPRRWKSYCNPKLSKIITNLTGGDDWVLNTKKLTELRKTVVDEEDEYVESNEEEEAELQPAPIPLKLVCMANMCVVGGHVVNGVANIHIEIVKQDVFSDFYKFSTDKFQKETNEVTPRRWKSYCNPKLSKIITNLTGGDDWVLNTKKFTELRKMDAYGWTFFKISGVQLKHQVSYIAVDDCLISVF